MKISFMGWQTRMSGNSRVLDGGTCTALYDPCMEAMRAWIVCQIMSYTVFTLYNPLYNRL